GRSRPRGGARRRARPRHVPPASRRPDAVQRPALQPDRRARAAARSADVHPGSSRSRSHGREHGAPRRHESAPLCARARARGGSAAGPLRDPYPRRDRAPPARRIVGRTRADLRAHRSRQRRVHAPRLPQDRGRSAQPLPPALFRDKESVMKALTLGMFSVILALAAVGATMTLPTAHAATRYVCPPCGAPCDTASFDKPGTCAGCGMALVDASTIQAEPARKKVAILVFDGVEIIDYTGPWEVFGGAGYQVYTVAEKKAPV